MAYSFSANTKIWDSRRFLAEIRTVKTKSPFDASFTKRDTKKVFSLKKSDPHLEATH